MTGWKIFLHSVFLLNRNFNTAIRVFSPLIFMSVFVTLLSYGGMMEGVEDEAPGLLGLRVAVGLLEMFIAIWVAVAWHRYILMEEKGGRFPTFHGGRMLEYLGATILVGLTLIGAVLLFLILGFALAAGADALFGLEDIGSTIGVLLPLCGTIFVGWVLSRLSPIFPAVALGEKATLKGVWKATSGAPGSVLMILPLFYLVNFGLITVIEAAALPISTLVGGLIIAIVNCACAMVGISILTSIYGVIIEGREI